jgi:hypothetical protein
MKLAGKFDPLLARGKRRVRADVDSPNNPPNRTAAAGSPPPHLPHLVVLQEVDHLHLSHLSHLLIQRH